MKYFPFSGPGPVVIPLSPTNKEFKDIILKKVSEEEFKVIAEFVRVIE